MAETVRIGMIVPSGGPEGDYYRYEEASSGAVKFYFTISRAGGEPGQDHDPAALRETGQIDRLCEAAERLRPFRLDALQWACTSGSFVMGRSFAELQASELTRAMGVPAASTSLAFAEACQQMRFANVAVLATYPEPAARLFTSFLGEYDITAVRVRCLGAPSGWDVVRFDEEFIGSNAAGLVAPGIDAILVPDTALPSLHFLERLEAHLRLPVLTANAVTVWHAVQIAGGTPHVPHFGRLLAGA